jgi:2-dehydro-3-deoxyphosphogalactonate aldolase
MTHSFEAMMQEFPMVAIMRGVGPDDVLEHGRVLIEAGFRIIEVPLNSPNPFESIRLLQETYGETTLIGAGTVLTMDQLAKLIATGAGLMVAPHTDPEIIRAAKTAGLYTMPGFFTVTEAFAAIHAGADALKIFPAEALSSLKVISAMGAVIPKEVRLCPVGGVSPDNVREYINAGAGGFGLGSALYKKGQSVDQTRLNALAFVAAWNEGL